MRIKAKGALKDKPKDRFYDLEDGDEITVPDDVGRYWVGNGWVKDLDSGKDNTPSNKPVTLEINEAAHATKDTLEAM